jgi:hypothetical protein
MSVDELSLHPLSCQLCRYLDGLKSLLKTDPSSSSYNRWAALGFALGPIQNVLFETRLSPVLKKTLFRDWQSPNKASSFEQDVKNVSVTKRSSLGRTLPLPEESLVLRTGLWSGWTSPNGRPRPYVLGLS